MTGQYSGTDKGNANLTLTDGTTTGYGINTITVSGGDLTSAANGEAVIDTSGAGGGGTVTSIATSGGLSGGTITTTGTLTTTGVLEDLNTVGAPSADGEILVATGAGAFAYETGATARTSLGAAASGANSDITSITGLTTPLTVAQGGTGGATAAQARDIATGLGVLPKIADIVDTAAGTYTITIADAGKIIFLNGGTVPITVSFPTNDPQLIDGFQVVIFCTDASNAVAFGPIGGGTINGSLLTTAMTQYKAYTVVMYAEYSGIGPSTNVKWMSIG